MNPNYWPEEEHPSDDYISMGALNIHGNGVGQVLISPDGDHSPVAIHLKFPYTNSVTEYEHISSCYNSPLIWNQRSGGIHGHNPYHLPMHAQLEVLY